MQKGASVAKRGLFGALVVMAAFVLFNNERFFVDHADPAWAYYQSVLDWIVPHGLAGLVALVCGALQFSTRLRIAMPHVHRQLGYAYIAGVLAAAILSMVITHLHNELPLQVAIYIQATLWVLATGIAFYCIRHRRVEAHREWMIRSYAITLIFLTNRVLDAIPAIGALDTGTDPTTLWICNVAAWVIPTLIVSGPRIVKDSRTSGA